MAKCIKSLLVLHFGATGAILESIWTNSFGLAFFSIHRITGRV